jgi:hypothetical protein
MVLVLLQHSYQSANYSLILPSIDLFIWGVTYCAAIAFVSISGIMFSYFLYINPQWIPIYRHYASRAAFLILAVHPVINLMSCSFRLAGKGYPEGGSHLLKMIFLDFPITDTIGVCMLLSPVFIIRLSTLKRVVFIVTMLIMTIYIRAFITPANPEMVMLKEALFGTLGIPKMFWFSLCPWFAIFLTGSFMGQAMARLKQGTLQFNLLIRKMKWTGSILLLLSLFLTASYKIIKMSLGDGSTLLYASYPGQTTTLLPGYLAVLIWLLAAMMHRIEISRRYDRFIWYLSIIGRTSLFFYVIQFAIVESVPAFLGYKGTLGVAGFLFLFVTGLIITSSISYVYGRMRGWIQKNDFAELSRNVSNG